MMVRIEKRASSCFFKKNFVLFPIFHYIVWMCVCVYVWWIKVCCVCTSVLFIVYSLLFISNIASRLTSHFYAIIHRVWVVFNDYGGSEFEWWLQVLVVTVSMSGDCEWVWVVTVSEYEWWLWLWKVTVIVKGDCECKRWRRVWEVIVSV
jgi:hypothetical protein